jgi:hypothetical protein
MEASLVVPGPLDVAGTLSRFHLWGEHPANRFANLSPFGRWSAKWFLVRRRSGPRDE